ncbi:MAG: hypothetical protein RIB98_13055 [Acidimicrobiales bacterium]
MKVRYTSRSLERHVAATREQTWFALLAELERRTGGDDALVESVLSLEPPWRRCARVVGPMPLEFYEGTFVLRDDGDECHLSWGVVVDPEPTDAGWAHLEAAMTATGALMDRVVAAAAD